MYIHQNNRPGDGKLFVGLIAVATFLVLTCFLLVSPELFSTQTPPDVPPAPESTPASAPATSAPATSAPATSAPATSAPATSAPATSAPATSAPATSAPATSAPATSAPATSAPATTATATSAPAITWITPGTTASAPATSAPKYVSGSDCVLGETEDAGQAYQDKIVFLGDSTTYSFLYYGVLSGGKSSTQVWTPSSRTLTLDGALTTKILYPETGEELSLKDALKTKKPEILLITLGVNGISYMDEKYFKTVYTKLVGIVQEASPDTTIILNSIFPVAKSWQKTKSINNDKINSANGWILSVAEDCGAYYLDSHSVLAVDPGGYMPESYQNGDGLHLNKDSCNLVLNYIRTHAAE